MKYIKRLALVVLLLLTACGRSALPESIEPLTGTEPRHLSFQIFEGGRDPAIPFDKIMIYTPASRSAMSTHSFIR